MRRSRISPYSTPQHGKFGYMPSKYPHAFPFKLGCRMTPLARKKEGVVLRYYVLDRATEQIAHGTKLFRTRKNAEVLLSKMNAPYIRPERRTQLDQDNVPLTKSGRLSKIGKVARMVYVLLSEQPTKQRTDEQLAYELHAEFPNKEVDHWLRRLSVYFQAYNAGNLPGMEGPPKQKVFCWHRYNAMRLRRPKGWRQTIVSTPQDSASLPATP
jgi:hypothetical protein